jgi:hypothetical protein
MHMEPIIWWSNTAMSWFMIIYEIMTMTVSPTNVTLMPSIGPIQQSKCQFHLPGCCNTAVLLYVTKTVIWFPWKQNKQIYHITYKPSSFHNHSNEGTQKLTRTLYMGRYVCPNVACSTFPLYASSDCPLISTACTICEFICWHKCISLASLMCAAKFSTVGKKTEPEERKQGRSYSKSQYYY